MLHGFQHLEINDKAHLGDVVASVQWAHSFQKNTSHKCLIYSDWVCPCHGVRASDQIREVLPLLETNVKQVQYKYYDPKIDIPIYYNSDFQIVYEKAKNLPPRKNHITVQFHARGRHGNGLDNHTIKEIARMLHGYEVFSLGDQLVSGVNVFRGNIKDKFDLIASAKYHIGVDSGMAHLAAMTNTTSLVIAPDWFHNRYVSQNNIIMCEEDNSFDFVSRLLNGSMSFFKGFNIPFI